MDFKDLSEDAQKLLESATAMSWHDKSGAAENGHDGKILFEILVCDDISEDTLEEIENYLSDKYEQAFGEDPDIEYSHFTGDGVYSFEVTPTQAPEEFTDADLIGMSKALEDTLKADGLDKTVGHPAEEGDPQCSIPIASAAPISSPVIVMKI